MKNEVFLDLVRANMERVFDTINIKKAEYSITDDRLDQFKKVAAFLDKHPMEVLAGFMVKHSDSVYNCIAMTARGEDVSIGMWEEKITDHIVYLLLLMGLVCEKPGECECKCDTTPN